MVFAPTTCEDDMNFFWLTLIALSSCGGSISTDETVGTLTKRCLGKVQISKEGSRIILFYFIVHL